MTSNFCESVYQGMKNFKLYLYYVKGSLIFSNPTLRNNVRFPEKIRRSSLSATRKLIKKIYYPWIPNWKTPIYCLLAASVILVAAIPYFLICKKILKMKTSDTTKHKLCHNKNNVKFILVAANIAFAKSLRALPFRKYQEKFLNKCCWCCVWIQLTNSCNKHSP